MAHSITPVASGRITLQLWLEVRDTPITTKDLNFTHAWSDELRCLLRAYGVKEFRSNHLADFYPGFPFVVTTPTIAVPRSNFPKNPLELECWFEVAEVEKERLHVQSSLKVLAHTTGLKAKLKSRWKKRSFQLITLPRVIYVARPTLATQLPKTTACCGSDEFDPDELDLRPLRG